MESTSKPSVGRGTAAAGLSGLNGITQRPRTRGLANAIQAAIDRGEIRRGVDADKIATLFTSVPDGVGITSMLKGAPLRPNIEEVQELWDALYQSLQA